MRSALITLLLIVATATQPLMAIPAACTMGGEHQKMSCASCCRATRCCAISDQQQSSPVEAVTTPSVDLAATIPLAQATAPAPFERPAQRRSFALLTRDTHAPPPLALNCIQLI